MFYLTAIATGMRRGELCALRWNDLHGGGAVTVQHQVLVFVFNIAKRSVIDKKSPLHFFFIVARRAKIASRRAA